LDIDSLTHTSGEWLRGSGPDSDIVISSRIRLARNLAQFPFPNRADDDAKSRIEELLRTHLDQLRVGTKLSYVDVARL
jgi:protein arginine kinase